MRKIAVSILFICVTAIAGCGMSKDKPMKNMEESNTIESESDDQDRNAETISSGILNDMSEPEDNRKPLTDYSLITGEQEGYNVILEVNGYQYFFNMAMQPEKIELQSPKEREEERYGEKVKVFSIAVSDGKSEEGRVSLYKAEEVDKDTYTEFTNVSEKETEYATSQDTQYIILDGNFVNTSVTWERFQEHFAREKNTFYYFIENDGVITQIWEPYIP